MAAQEQPKTVPVDDYVRDELYPEYKPAFGSQPFVAGPVRPFSKAGNARYWLRDSLHFSEGMVPASIALLDDAQTWGAQLGAEIVRYRPTAVCAGFRATWRSARCLPQPSGPPPAGRRLTNFSSSTKQLPQEKVPP